jgi:hypothetical protein
MVITATAASELLDELLKHAAIFHTIAEIERLQQQNSNGNVPQVTR